MKKDPKIIGYWILTVCTAIVLIGSGGADLMGAPDILKAFETLGYPTYLATILGAWKVLGALAILAPGTPRLKEWAYAGVTFSMTGALASHLFSGDPLSQVIPPALFTLLNLGSWWLRPSSRKLPSA